MSDIVKCQVGQVWIFEDGHVDKYNVDDREYAVHGRRPVVVVAISGYKAVCVPFTSSFNKAAVYSHIGAGIVLEDNRMSYAMFDSVFTCGVGEFSRYIGTLKDHKLNKIVGLAISYLNGEIEFMRGRYVKLPPYMAEEYRHRRIDIVSRLADNGIHITYGEDSEEPRPEIESRSSRKYSDELITFVMDRNNSTKDSMEKFGLTQKQVYSIRQYYKKKK